MITKLWHKLSDITVTLDSSAKKLQMVEELAPKFILGVDFQDAVHNKRPMAIRRIRVNQPWAHLVTTEQPIVLFCGRIPEPIVPTSTCCKAWAAVPPHSGYLVAMGLTVHTLLDRQDNGLAEGLDWCASSELIGTHKNGNAVQHVQKLQSKKKPSPNKTTRITLQSYLHGCFIFGKGTEKKCTCTTISDPNASTSDDGRIDSNLSPSINQTLSVSSMASATSADAGRGSSSQEESSSDSSSDASEILSSSTLESLATSSPVSPSSLDAIRNTPNSESSTLNPPLAPLISNGNIRGTARKALSPLLPFRSKNLKGRKS